MKFKIDLAAPKTSGVLFYITEDHSFSFETTQPVDLSLVYDYVLLWIDSESMFVRDFDGFNPHEGWINKTLTVPHVIAGGLFLVDAESLLETPWVAKRIIDHDTWNTYYDKDSGWICFGDYNTSETDQSVEFADGIVAVVSNNKIKAFWLKPVFTEPVNAFVTRTEL